MKSTKRVNGEEIELNPNNIPKGNVPDKSKIYVEDSLSRKFFRMSPGIGFNRLKSVLTFSFIYVFIVVIYKEALGDSLILLNQKMEVIDIVSILDLSIQIIPGMSIIIGVGLFLLPDTEGRKKVYIVSDDSVISTFYGTEEVSDSDIGRISLDDIEDIKFSDTSVQFVSPYNKIKLDKLNKTEVENIQNQIIFSS